MKRETFELFKKYGAMLAAQPYPLGEEARIILDTNEGVFGTKKGAKLANLRQKDIVKMADQHLSTHRSGMDARVISQTPFCQRCLQEGKSIPAVLDDMAQIIGPEAPIVDSTSNSKASSMKMALAIQKSSGLLVQDRIRDGVPAGYTLTVGRNLYEAVVALTVLEKCAEIYLKSSVIGGAKALSKMEAKKMRSFYQNTYSAAEAAAKAAEAEEAEEWDDEEWDEEEWDEEEWEDADESEDMDAPSWTPLEAELRQKLVDYGNKLVETGLVQGTWGNISIRLDSQYMLVTPSGRDYSSLTAADMVKVDIRSLKHEDGKKPTSEKELHAQAYQNRPEVSAVIHTHSKYCCIFAAANKDMPIEDAAAREIFGGSVKVGGHGKPGSTKLAKNTMKALGSSFGCTMANHGMVACGADIETAFENCSMLERCGETYINSRFK